MNPDSLVQYPTDFIEALPIIRDKLVGKSVPTPHLVRAAYHVVGYGLGKFAPDPVNTGGIASYPDEALAAQCTDLIEGRVQGPILDAFLRQLVAAAIKIIAARFGF